MALPLRWRLVVPRERLIGPCDVGEGEAAEILQGADGVCELCERWESAGSKLDVREVGEPTREREHGGGC